MAQTAELLGDSASAIPWPVSAATLAEVDVVIAALADDHDYAIAQLGVVRGCAIVSGADSPRALTRLRSLHSAAAASGSVVVVGCGLAPGYAEILAGHAATLFDSVDEVRIARAGAAGPASIGAVKEQRRDVPALFRSGNWKETSRLEEQVWFPEPIGAADCQVVRGGGDFVVASLGAGVAVTNTLAESKSPRWPNRADDGLGAIRVEVWGEIDGRREVVVYGAIDRVSIAAGAMLGVVAERIAVGTHGLTPGVHGTGALSDPAGLVGELARRGLQAAVFEGAPLS